jgi:hypothetical protein
MDTDKIYGEVSDIIAKLIEIHKELKTNGQKPAASNLFFALEWLQGVLSDLDNDG